jgi:EthD domain
MQITKKRLICCLSSQSGLDMPLFRQALAGVQPALQTRFGSDAEVMLSTRRADDPFADIGGERKIETLDGFLQVSYPESSSYDDILEALAGLGSDLAEAVDLRKSSLSLGKAIVLLDHEGSVFLGFLGRRRRDLSQQEMSDYWLNIHAPLAIKLMGPPHSFHGYDQLHVDVELSKLASQTAGFPFVEYHMGDSIPIPDLPRFLEAMAEPAVAQQLAEDEKQFLDITSWRGAFTDMLAC